MSGLVCGVRVFFMLLQQLVTFMLETLGRVDGSDLVDAGFLVFLMSHAQDCRSAKCDQTDLSWSPDLQRIWWHCQNFCFFLVLCCLVHRTYIQYSL